MAIAFDAESQGSQAGTTDLTISHTVTGSNVFLFAVLETDLTAVTPTASYNAISMTALDSRLDGAGNKIWSFYLPAPTTGTHNLVFGGKGASSGTYRGFGLSYTGVDQVNPIDSHNTNQAASGTTFSTATTVVASGCWLVGGANVDIAPPSFTTGTIRGSAVGNCIVGDSNATVATGSQSLAYSGSSAAWMGVVASIAPASAAAVTNRGTLLTLTGVGQ